MVVSAFVKRLWLKGDNFDVSPLKSAGWEDRKEINFSKNHWNPEISQDICYYQTHMCNLGFWVSKVSHNV